jgi:large subunit ribosomal protein L29
MPKKEKPFSYQQATVDELNARLNKTTQDLFKVRFRAASAPVKNTMQIRTLRREVARLNTFINQKAAAETAPAAPAKAQPRTTGKATAVAAAPARTAKPAAKGKGK